MAYDGSIKIDTKIDTGGFSSGVEKMKSIASKGVSAMTTAFAAVTAGIAAGGTAAATVGSSFEAAMSKVSAISGSTGKDLQSLTDKAKEMGAKTKFSASESAEALQYMAMAGWDTKSMLDGIDGIMSLAAADGLDLATTSDIVTDALTAFGLKASDSTHFADVLAKASSSANTNVSMLGESFKYVAPLAGTMGYSVEDVSVALGLMANASVKGSMAGTSLKTALSNLASPTQQMAEVMDKYKISISDTNGNALPLIDVLKQLREKFGGLSETEQTAAASTLFGKEAMSGMLAIINASDSDFKKLTENINNADGAAQSMADTMQDNLQGQITILKSALEGLGIEIYEGMQAPLKDAAIEAQGYVNRLTEAFTDGGLTGMIEEAGNIFGELAVKAAEAAPKMVDTAIKFVQSFVDGVAKNSDKLASAAVKIIETIISGVTNAAPKLVTAAKTIISAIVDNLVKLLPSELQKPVKDAVNTIKKSFEDGGIRRAINTVKTVLSNLAKVATNLAKTVLPPLAKVVDLVADNLGILLPLAVSVYTAYKSWKILSTITALFTAHTAAVTAESLAEAASLGTITLKQIAVGALTGEITLATAAQYAWNLAMSLNPIGLVLTAVVALTAGIVALCASYQEEVTSEQLMVESANELAEAYKGVSEAAIEYIDGISESGNALDGFNDSILLSKEKQQELAQKMDEVQTEITEIARTAKEKRTELTNEEIQRLDELFQKQKELADQQLQLQQGYQEVVKGLASDLAADHDMSLEEYAEYSEKYTATAEQTRDDTVKAAEDQRMNWLAQKQMLIGTDEQYTQEWYQKQVEQANKDYNTAVTNADKVCSDTLKILQDGYKNKSDAIQEYSKNFSKYLGDIESENTKHSNLIKQLEINRDAELNEYKNASLSKRHEIEEKWGGYIEDANEKYNKKITKLNEDFTDSFSEEQQKQLGTWLAMVSQTELYGGKISESDKKLVTDSLGHLGLLPEESRLIIEDTMQGMLNAIEEKSPVLYAKVSNMSDTVLNILRKVFDTHSPSKKTKKIFTDVIEGGEVGVDDEAPKLYKQADDVASTFTKRMQAGVSADGLVSKMKAAVSAGRAFVAQKLTANVVHEVELHNDDNNKKYFFKGDVVTHLNIDGREFAVVTAPYMSEELAWEGK